MRHNYGLKRRALDPTIRCTVAEQRFNAPPDRGDRTAKEVLSDDPFVRFLRFVTLTYRVRGMVRGMIRVRVVSRDSTGWW